MRDNQAADDNSQERRVASRRDVLSVLGVGIGTGTAGVLVGSRRGSAKNIPSGGGGGGDDRVPLNRAAATDFNAETYYGARQPGTESVGFGNPEWTYNATATHSLTWATRIDAGDVYRDIFRLGGHALGARRDTLDSRGRHYWEVREDAFPDGHPARQKEYPLCVPAATVTGQQYDITVSGDARLMPDSHHRAFMTQSGLWRFDEYTTHEPDQRTSIAEATYDAVFAPPTSPEGVVLDKLTSEEWVRRWAPYLSKGLGKAASTAGTIITVLQVYDKLAGNCDSWNERITSHERLYRDINVCNATAAGHFVSFEVEVPKDGGGKLAVQSAFDAGIPIEESRSLSTTIWL